MKKITTIIIIFCFVGSLQAQKVQMGLKFNPNLGWFKVDNKTFIENKGIGIGFSYGLIMDFHFLENVALCIEPAHLFYNPSTTVKRIDTILYSDVLKWNFQYIDIPISLKMMTNQIGKFKYFGKIGITAGIKSTAKLDGNKSNSSVTALDFSMQIGGGVHYSLGGNTALLLGASYHNGLARINKDYPFTNLAPNPIYTVGLKDVNLKSSYISIDIGILF